MTRHSALIEPEIRNGYRAGRTSDSGQELLLLVATTGGCFGAGRGSGSPRRWSRGRRTGRGRRAGGRSRTGRGGTGGGGGRRLHFFGVAGWRHDGNKRGIFARQ